MDACQIDHPCTAECQTFLSLLRDQNLLTDIQIRTKEHLTDGYHNEDILLYALPVG
jgi:hypothetical protein